MRSQTPDREPRIIVQRPGEAGALKSYLENQEWNMQIEGCGAPIPRAPSPTGSTRTQLYPNLGQIEEFTPITHKVRGIGEQCRLQEEWETLYPNVRVQKPEADLVIPLLALTASGPGGNALFLKELDAKLTEQQRRSRKAVKGAQLNKPVELGNGVHIARAVTAGGTKKVMDKIDVSQGIIGVWMSETGREGQIHNFLVGILEWAEENPEVTVIVYTGLEVVQEVVRDSMERTQMEDSDSSSSEEEAAGGPGRPDRPGTPFSFEEGLTFQNHSTPWNQPVLGPFLNNRHKRGRERSERKYNPYSQPCVLPVYIYSYHAPNLTQFSPPGAWDKKDEVHDIPWYDATRKERGTVRYAPKGISGPFKEGYLAARYDHHRERCLRRDRSVERSVEQQQKEISEWQEKVDWGFSTREKSSNAWNRSLMGPVEETNLGLQIQQLSLQDIIPNVESHESTEGCLKRVEDTGVTLKPSEVIWNQARTPGEDDLEGTIRELQGLVSKGHVKLQQAMGELMSKPQCTITHQEKLLIGVPGGGMIAAKWSLLSDAERNMELFVYDRM